MMWFRLAACALVFFLFGAYIANFVNQRDSLKAQDQAMFTRQLNLGWTLQAIAPPDEELEEKFKYDMKKMFNGFLLGEVFTYENYMPRALDESMVSSLEQRVTAIKQYIEMNPSKICETKMVSERYQCEYKLKFNQLNSLATRLGELKHNKPLN